MACWKTQPHSLFRSSAAVLKVVTAPRWKVKRPNTALDPQTALGQPNSICTRLVLASRPALVVSHTRCPVPLQFHHLQLRSLGSLSSLPSHLISPTHPPGVLSTLTLLNCARAAHCFQSTNCNSSVRGGGESCQHSTPQCTSSSQPADPRHSRHLSSRLAGHSPSCWLPLVSPTRPVTHYYTPREQQQPSSNPE